MKEFEDKIKLSKWLDENIPHYFPNKGPLISIIKSITEYTVPIRGLLEKGITTREIQHRMNLDSPVNPTKNIYDETQIHEDILTHGILVKALKESENNYFFIASEESEPVFGEGKFGITIDPVDGSSNVAVNRTVGTIVGIFNEKGEIICSFYVLYGIFTNLLIALNGSVAEFILDTSPYSMTFYHYVFQGYKEMPNFLDRGIQCLGGDPTNWSPKCKNYAQKLIDLRFKNRYSGSLIADFHAIIHYGGVYAYFPSPKPKIRFYYEWLPLAFMAKTLGGEFYAIGDDSNPDIVRKIEDFPPLTKENLLKNHALTCGGILGSKKVVELFLAV